VAFHKKLLKILACPECKSELVLKNNKLFCSECKKEFKIKKGIPIFID